MVEGGDKVSGGWCGARREQVLEPGKALQTLPLADRRPASHVWLAVFSWDSRLTKLPCKVICPSPCAHTTMGSIRLPHTLPIYSWNKPAFSSFPGLGGKDLIWSDGDGCISIIILFAPQCSSLFLTFPAKVPFAAPPSFLTSPSSTLAPLCCTHRITTRTERSLTGCWALPPLFLTLNTVYWSAF